MVAGNTETNINVTYDDTNGKLDFVANAGGSGLLPTDYTYTANGASVSGFILAWESGSTDITTGTGAAVAASTNLVAGNTITISNSATGEASIHRFTDTDDFIYGARAGGPASSDFELLYNFPTAAKHLSLIHI